MLKALSSLEEPDWDAGKMTVAFVNHKCVSIDDFETAISECPRQVLESVGLCGRRRRRNRRRRLFVRQLRLMHEGRLLLLLLFLGLLLFALWQGRTMDVDDGRGNGEPTPRQG